MTDLDEIPPSDILIVDDNVQNAELLQAYLEPLNGRVRIAVDGIDALEQVARKQPDIILLDIMMPRMSGFEVCRRLKNDPETRDIPIVMVTALNELADVERGVESGADDFLSKPVNKLELLTRVKSVLRVRHLKSELERTLSYLAEIEGEERRNIDS
ncbi:MAG: chemotaxis protein CheY [Phycisphaerae bacterium SM23_30]|nr:MAG: chemotaxis protein CheY [Phycisphaerae bacterium SM23_30]